MRPRPLGVLLAISLSLACNGTGTGTSAAITYQLQITTAAPSSATIGSTIAVAATVIKQQNGTATPVSGQTVAFTVLLGGGSLPGGISTTVQSAANGSVGATWQLGPSTGPQTLRASISATEFVDFTTTTTPLPAAQLSIAIQPSAIASIGTPFAQQPVIQLRDANNVPIGQAGVTVTASVASGGTLGGTTTVVTSSGGVAAFSNLSLGAGGLATLRFNATLGGQAVNVTSNVMVVLQPGLSQLALAGAPSPTATDTVPLFQQPVVQLKDGTGIAVHQAGVLITAAVVAGTPTLGASGGGTENLTVATDANGQAVFHGLALSGDGTSQIDFTATGFNPAVSAPITVMPPAALVSLPNGLAAGPVGGEIGTVIYFAFTVPAGTTSLTITTWGGFGSIQLAARGGSFPTSSDFDCQSAIAGPSQTCSASTAPSGTWYIAMSGVTAYSNATVQVEALNAACASLPLTANVTVSGTLTPGASCSVDVYGVLVDRYALTVPTSQAMTLATSGSNGSIFLSIKRAQDIGISLTTTDSVTPVMLLAAGTYDVLVEDNIQGGTAVPLPYTLVATPVIPPSVVGCTIFAAPSTGLAINLTLTTADCPGTTTGTFSHRVVIALGTGQTVTVTMASAAFDPFVRIEASIATSSAATVLASDDNSGGGTTAKVTYTNSGDPDLFTLEMSSATPGATGTYTMTEDVSPPSFLQGRLVPPRVVPQPALMVHRP